MGVPEPRNPLIPSVVKIDPTPEKRELDKFASTREMGESTGDPAGSPAWIRGMWVAPAEEKLTTGTARDATILTSSRAGRPIRAIAERCISGRIAGGGPTSASKAQRPDVQQHQGFSSCKYQVGRCKTANQTTPAPNKMSQFGRRSEELSGFDKEIADLLDRPYGLG